METIEIEGKILPYQDDGWSHCDICDQNIWDENIKWSESSWEDGSRDWWIICETCFSKKEDKE